MNRYWTRIALGALLVFCMGFVGLTAVRKGKAQLRAFLTTAATRLPLRLANIGFRLDGRRVGEVTRLDVVRHAASELGRVTGHVQLTEPEAIAALADCSLTVDDLHRVNSRTSFFCADASELQSGRLLEVGEIRFEPGAFQRPLFLPRRVVDDWRRSEIQQLEASLARDGRGGVRANGTFDVLDRRRGSQRGSFDLHADSQGAVLSVRDEQNRSLLDLRAGHEGLRLNVRDRYGRNLLRLVADSLGAALNIQK
jgi:hypothetical protein